MPFEQEAVEFTPSLTSLSVTRSTSKLQGQTLVFSGEDQSDDDGNEDDVVFHPCVNQVHVRTPPPKFKGDSTKFIARSEEFMRCAVRWGFNKTLTATPELDVSDHTKCYGDYVNAGIEKSVVYTTQNAWHGFLDAAGNKVVRNLIV